MIFREIHIDGFQSYVKAMLTLSPGVNIICGPSHSGKSAIIRAINLVVNNRPLGDGFINDDMDNVYVCIITENGSSLQGVSREKAKDKGVNSYEVLGLDSEDNVPFTAFGSEVPEEVRALLNLTDINVQSQHSPYFLVMDPPGQVAAYIRQAVGLDKIDVLGGMLKTKARTAGLEVKDLDKKIEAGDKKLKVLTTVDLDALQVKVDEATTLEQTSVKLAAEESELGRQVRLLKHNQLRSDVLSRVDLENMASTITTCSELNSRRATLGAYASQLADVVGELTAVVAQEQVIAIPDNLYDKIDSARRVVAKHDNLVADCEWLAENIGKIDNIEDAEFQVGENIKVKEGAIAEAQQLLTVCPHCGQELTDAARCCLLGGS